jgi:hypothetical protein
MRKVTIASICLAACLAIASSGKAQVVTGSEVYSNGWFRNKLVNTGLYNEATGTGIFSPYAGMMQTYRNGNFRANETYADGWFRNMAVNTGLYNEATGTGIFSPYTGMMQTYRNGNFRANETYADGWFRNMTANTGLYNEATGTGIFSPYAGMMQIYRNGSLMIGNTTAPPGYKLYVERGILTEKIKVAVNGSAQWADYVFAKDYKLLPLAQVEKYIQDNQHLPNVPSAADMVKEGNDLGKTTAKLLEKIEELTLYLIQQQKEIETLKRALNNTSK